MLIYSQMSSAAARKSRKDENAQTKILLKQKLGTNSRALLNESHVSKHTTRKLKNTKKTTGTLSSAAERELSTRTFSDGTAVKIHPQTKAKGKVGLPRGSHQQEFRFKSKRDQ